VTLDQYRDYIEPGLKFYDENPVLLRWFKWSYSKSMC